MTDDPRQLLTEAVKDKSDDEIRAFAEQMGGTEQLLDMIFEGMKDALDPDKAQDCVIGFVLEDGGQTYPYTLTVKDKAASYEKKQPENARVTLSMSAPDYLRLISGHLDGMQAFMQGKLRLQGDIMFAQQMQTMFGTGS